VKKSSRTRPDIVERTPQLLLYSLLALVSIVIYGQSLGFPLIWDSHILVVQNPAIRTFDPVTAFSTPTTIDPATSELAKLYYYRPVLQLFFSAWYQLVGENAAMWHGLAVALNLIAVFLVYRLMLAMDQPRWSALAVALLFAVNPGRVSAVAWVYGLSNQFFGILILAAFLFWVLRMRYWSLAFFLLALGCRETAVLFPVITFIWELLFGKERRPWGWLGAQVALVGGYLAMRSLVVGGAEITTLAPLAWLNSVAVIVAAHVNSLAWPVWGVRFYPFEDFSAFSARVLLSYAVLGASLAALYWGLRRNRWVAFWLLWSGVWVSIHFNVGRFGDFLMDEKTNYLLALSFAVLLVTISRLAGRHVLVVCAVVIVVHGALSTWRVTYWHDSVAFFGSAAELAPGYPRLRQNLGLAQFEVANYPAAGEAFRKVIELAPDHSMAWNWLGRVRYMDKDYKGAIQAWLRSLELDPGNTAAAFDLSHGYKRIGDEKAAARYHTLFLKLQAERPIPIITRPQNGD
jgi:hypothetical protein